MFESFLRSYNAELRIREKNDSAAMIHYVSKILKVPVPDALGLFWKTIGAGYFGDRALFFFGDGVTNRQRDSLQEWNEKDFWNGIYPSPDQGGPVFFAETCFGDQIGFRWENGAVIYLIFCVDTFDSFKISGSDEELFQKVLADRQNIIDENAYDAVLSSLGPLSDGNHYAPIVSPHIGGDGSIANMCVETANVHLRTAIYAYKHKSMPRF